MTENDTTPATDTPNAEVVEKTPAEKIYGSDPKPEASKEAKAEDAQKEGDQTPSEDKPEDESAETTEDGKPKEGDQKPVEYKLKAPKDSGISAEGLKEIEEFAKTNGLSQDAAQALVERENDLLLTIKEQQQEQMEKMSNEWRKTVENDKVWGGDNLKQTSFYSNQALQKFGSNELRQGLIDTGFGNHPEVVKFFAKVGKALSPGTFEKQGLPPVQRKSAEEQLYGSTSQQ